MNIVHLGILIQFIIWRYPCMVEGLNNTHIYLNSYLYAMQWSLVFSPCRTECVVGTSGLLGVSPGTRDSIQYETPG